MSDVRLRASIVVIGDEILGGYVQDTNSGWLAGRLQHLGVPLERVSTVPDDLAAIHEALEAELARLRPRLVLTSGGIGSTPDDLTMEAVATYLDRSLVVEPEIDRRISRALEWTAAQGVTLTHDHERAMRKMSLVPDGAYLLDGARGVAPGVAVDIDGGCEHDGGATLVILPGVPTELRRIASGSIEPLLLAGRGRPQHVEELTHPYPESVLNEVFNRLVAEFPDVHLGSYPGAECIVRLKGEPERVGAAMGLVREALAALGTDPGAQRLRAAWAERHAPER
jgi:molybdenum cofactor synthesis domain-containing protein